MRNTLPPEMGTLMNRIQDRRTVFSVVVLAGTLLLGADRVGAQRGQPVPAGPPPTAKASAPADFTGYWVSVITEDWRLRMVVPRKGDVANVPVNPEGRKVADSWDPARDAAAGAACKAYGAPGVMRLPGRLHITWENDNTLRIDTDTGQQTRLLHFGQAQRPAGERSWQGTSAAIWEFAGTGGRGEKAGDHLKVVTTNLRAGYLRRNGVPYSENAVLTEYFDRHSDVGAEWITHTRIVDDPTYLRLPYIVTSHFKRESDNAKWTPTPCQAQ